MTAENWLTAGGLIVSGIIGYFIKYILDRRSEFITKNAEIKREAYSDSVDLMLAIISQSKLGEISQRDMLKNLNDFYSKYILYASPKVVNSFGDYMQYIYSHSEDMDSKTMMMLMTTVFRDMREDVGLSNKDIGKKGERLLRGRFNDYESIISPDTPVPTTVKNIKVDEDVPVKSNVSAKNTKNKKRKKKR
jgi:hypothetical protein